MPDTIDKAVWLEDLERVCNVIQVLEQLYDTDMWTGGMLFQDVQGGFLLVACFDPDTYTALGTPWEVLFPPTHLRPVTLEEACADRSHLRPWLASDIANILRAVKLLPRPRAAVDESVPPLAAVRAERDPPGGPTVIRDLVAVALICCCSGYLIGAALYVWWRLRTIDRDLHRVGWDLDALAGALRKREENETPERTHH